MLVFDFVSVRPPKQTEREGVALSHLRWEMGNFISATVTTEFFSARRSRQFVREPWNRFAALASGVTEGRSNVRPRMVD